MRVLRTVLMSAAILLPGVAQANEEVVSSTRTALPAAVKTDSVPARITPADTKAQFMARLGDGPGLEQERIDYEAWAGAQEDAKMKRVHGTASVSVGTGGYRSASVSAIMPVGDNGTLGIAYSQTDFGENGGFLYDDASYGYDRYGRGRRGGSSQSLALSLDMSSGARNGRSCAADWRFDDADWDDGDRRCMTSRRSAFR